MASHDPQEQGILHERLKDQIAISIKESLDKATSVLSSLHRVHSYLDVLKTMPSFRSGTGGEGLKNALEQVQSIRTDAANLLQTIYLTEIGLQSLQDFDKQGSGTVNLVPILAEPINSTGLDSPVINSNEEEPVEGTELSRSREVGETGHPSPTSVEDSMPPPKKL